MFGVCYLQTILSWWMRQEGLDDKLELCKKRSNLIPWMNVLKEGRIWKDVSYSIKVEWLK